MSKRITLSSAIFAYLRIDRASFTNINYASCLKRMEQSIGGERDVKLITLEDLIDYTHEIHKHVRQSTFAQYVTIIRQFFNWCVKCHYIKHSPAQGLVVRRPKRRSPDRNQPIPPEVLTAMLQATITNPRDHTIILFMADTGCRIGAVARLEISALELNKGRALVHEKGDRHYYAYFGSETTLALKNWLRKRPLVEHDFVFTSKRHPYNPLHGAAVSRMIGNLSKLLTGTRYTGHGIRHSVGHALANQGVPVTITQQKLGHQSPHTTISRYYPDQFTPQLAEMSRAYSLAALKSLNDEEDEEPPTSPKIIRFKGR